jgi:hypothetical protein
VIKSITVAISSAILPWPLAAAAVEAVAMVMPRKYLKAWEWVM